MDKFVSIDSTPAEIRDLLTANGVSFAKNAKRATLEKLAKENELWAHKTRSAVPDQYKKAYGKEQNCGDEIAAILKDADVESVARQNGIDLERWQGRNAGMVRMNLGNVLRGRMRRGDHVVIAGQEWNKPEKKGRKQAA